MARNLIEKIWQPVGTGSSRLAVMVVSLTFFTNSPGKKNVIRYTMKQGL